MGFGELMLLSMLAFLLFGPKKTPEIARKVAQTIAGIKQKVSDLEQNLTMAVNMPPEAIPDPAIEAQRQSIVGMVPAKIAALASDAAVECDQAGAHSIVAPAEVALLPISKEMSYV
jgi:TatA/E family protein of Tat protein translocase